MRAERRRDERKDVRKKNQPPTVNMAESIAFSRLNIPVRINTFMCRLNHWTILKTRRESVSIYPVLFLTVDPARVPIAVQFSLAAIRLSGACSASSYVKSRSPVQPQFPAIRNEVGS